MGAPTPIWPRVTPRVIGTTATVVSAVVFLWSIGTPAYWLDEATTASLVQRSWQSLIEVGVARDPALLAYYLVVKPFAPAPGGEALLRLPSALAAALAVGLVAWFASRWMGRVAGVTTAVLLVASPVMSRYAQEARPYALATLSVTLLVLTWWQATRPGSSNRWWWGYAVSVAAVLVFNTLAATVLVGPLASAVLSGSRRGPLLRRTIAVTAGALVVCGPVLFLVATRATGVAHPISFTPGHVWAAVSTEAGGDGAAVVALILALAGLAVLVRRDAALAALVGGWAFAGPVLLVALSAAGRPFLVPRYFVSGAPAVAMLVGTLMSAAVGMVRLPRPVRLALPAALCAAAVAVGLPAQLDLRVPAGHGDDVRPLVALLDDASHRTLPVVVQDRLWTLSIQAYDPGMLVDRMPTIVNPRPRVWIAPTPASAATSEARLSRLDQVALVVRQVGGAVAPVQDAKLPPGLRGRSCTQAVQAFSGWWLDDLSCRSSESGSGAAG